MEPKLLLFLKPDSNIARFQSLFDIVETFDDDSYRLWIFKTLDSDPRHYPEQTSLQKALKQYLLEGHNIGAGVEKLN